VRCKERGERKNGKTKINFSYRIKGKGKNETVRAKKEINIIKDKQT
jgi:hypothetical protein